MAIVLTSEIIYPKVSKQGSEIVNIPAGQWIHYRYGTPQAPIDILLAQVPAGKKWKLTANVYIEETDA